eukprot:gene13390-15755_t
MPSMAVDRRTPATKPVFRPQIENLFVPESPCNIKLTGNDIRPMMSATKRVGSGNLFDQFREEQEANAKAKSARKKLAASSPSLMQFVTKTVADATAKDKVQSKLLEKFMSAANNDKEEDSKDDVSKLKELVYNSAPETIVVDTVPLDRAIKTQITLMSNDRDFAWVASAWADKDLRARVNVKEESRGARLVKALRYYVAPSAPLPWDAATEVVASDPAKYRWVESRWTEWEATFGVLSTSFLAGDVGSFYLIAADWTVLFLRVDSMVVAKLNPATKKMRDLLTLDGVEWTTPFLRGDESSSTTSKPQDDEAMILELKELAKAKRSSDAVIKKRLDPAYYQTPRSSSLLLIDGASNVSKLIHCLRTRLLWSNRIHAKASETSVFVATHTSGLSRSLSSTSIFTPRKRTAEQAAVYTVNDAHLYILCRDVPTLICGDSFVGGTLAANRILSNGAFTKRAAVSSSQPSNGDAKAFKLEIDGPILPESCQKLVEMFAEDNGQYSIKMYNNETTYGLNYWPTGDHSKLLGRNVIRQLSIHSSTNITITPTG